jgi:hypothetical protein
MAAQARWRAVLTDRTYKPQGELYNLTGLQYQRSLNKLATCSFTARMDNQHINRLADADGFVKLYRDTALQYVGPIITAEQTVDNSNQSIAVTSADIGWVLTKRLAGKSSTGTVYSSATNVAAIAKAEIDATNTMAETGLSTTVVSLTAGSARTYTAGPYRPILEIVQELGAALNGFDWVIRPVENWANGAVSGQKVGYLDAQTLLGQNRPTAVFEYGEDTRNNVLSFVRTRTRDYQANRVFHLRTDASDVLSRNNTGAQATWGILEDVINQYDISDANMRNDLLDEHVTIRGNPRDIIRLTPHIDPGVTGRLPLPFVDYDIGDIVTARIVTGNQVRFAGQIRVYGINISVEDATGFERVELVLEDDS